MLNMEKALLTKAALCQTDVKIKYQEKDGGNHVFEMSTGIYEVYKICALQYFENSNQKPRLRSYYCIAHTEDQSGQTVETLVRVLHRTKPILDQLKYTMNFYHTQCKILVNGKEANQYINDHKEIVGMVLQYPKLSSIDSDLLTVIRQRLSVMVGAKKKGRINDGLDDDGCLAIQGAEPDAVQNVVCGDDTMYTCAHCSQHVSVDSIECTRCNAWMHWRCENMSEEDFEEHVCDPDSEFVCMLCQNDIDTLGDSGRNDSAMTPVRDLIPADAANSSSATDTVHPPPTTPPTLSETTQAQQAVHVPGIQQTPQPTPNNDVVIPMDANRNIGSISCSFAQPPNPTTSAPDSLIGPMTTQVDAVSHVSIRESEVRTKEKALANKERRLKDLQKRLNTKEINLGDTLDRVDYSKAFISQMESKIKELENSNRLLRLKVLSIPESTSSGPSNDQQIPTPSFPQPNPPRSTHMAAGQYNYGQGPTTSHPTMEAYYPGMLSELNQRITSLELKMLENRLASVEQRHMSGVYPHPLVQPFLPHGNNSSWTYQPTVTYGGNPTSIRHGHSYCSDGYTSSVYDGPPKQTYMNESGTSFNGGVSDPTYRCDRAPDLAYKNDSDLHQTYTSNGVPQRTYTHEVVPQWTCSNGGVSGSSYGRDMVQDPVNGSDAVSNWTNADGCVSQTHQTAQRPDNTYSTNKVDCVASRNYTRKGGACRTKVGSHDVEPQDGRFSASRQPVSTFTSGVHNQSPHRSSRWSSSKNQNRTNHFHKNPARRKERSSCPTNSGHSKQRSKGDPPVRYLRELPKCEEACMEKQMPSDPNPDVCLIETPCRPPLASAVRNQDNSVSVNEQTPVGYFSSSFLSKRPLYKTRKKTGDKPRRSMVLPRQDVMQMESVGEETRQDRVIRSA